MVASVTPAAIFLGVCATVGLAFYSVWSYVNSRATERAKGLADKLDRAGIAMKAQEVVLTVASCAALAWIVLVLLLHPPVLVAIALIPVFGALGSGVFYQWVQYKIRRRLDAFVAQLELALRLISGGLRAGLGLRQALTIVIDELTDPSRYEFRRVIGQTNIGVSIFDAMDDLAERMPGNETLMMARVFRVQSQTGGDLAKVLEQLAATIRERRQVHRKVLALTAEGRMSRWVLMLIPLGLGVFIVSTQQAMGYALLFTSVGHVVILVLAVLEAAGYFWTNRLLKVNF